MYTFIKPNHSQKYRVAISCVLKEGNIHVTQGLNKTKLSAVTQLQTLIATKLNNKFVFTGTPTTVFVDEGKEKDPQFNRIDGAKDFDYIVEKLKKNK